MRGKTSLLSRLPLSMKMFRQRVVTSENSDHASMPDTM
jgi:hypothetical protein